MRKQNQIMNVSRYACVSLMCLVLPISSESATGSDSGSVNRPKRLDNNLKCVNLSDLNGDLPMDVTTSKQILKQTEDWEISTWGNAKWPKAKGEDS